MKKINYCGKTLNVPIRYYHDNLTKRFVEKRYENEEIAISRKYFDKTDNVLELGSCLGFVSCVLSDIVNFIVSVEANPELSACLQQTKQDNNLSNVDFINTYIDDKKRIIDFQTYDNIVAGSGDREDDGRGWGRTLKLYQIETSTLNEIDRINKINSLVIDIEGGELSFLKNHQSFLKQNIKKICIELHGFLMKEKTSQFDNKCIKLIINTGFKLVDKKGNTYYFEKK